MASSDDNAGFESAFNVVAAFRAGRDGTEVVEALVGIGVPASAVVLHRPGEGNTGEEVAELEAEMQDELDSGFGVVSATQAKRAVGAALMAGLIGIVLGIAGWLVWGHVADAGLSPLGGALIAVGVGGLAGATVGFVAGGGGLPWRQSEHEDRDDHPVRAERDLLVAVHVGDRIMAEGSADLLRALGAEEVHLVAAGGIPLPPQAQHPRPADPDGFWWTHAGHG